MQTAAIVIVILIVVFVYIKATGAPKSAPSSAPPHISQVLSSTDGAALAIPTAPVLPAAPSAPASIPQRAVKMSASNVSAAFNGMCTTGSAAAPIVQLRGCSLANLDGWTFYQIPASASISYAGTTLPTFYIAASSSGMTAAPAFALCPVDAADPLTPSDVDGSPVAVLPFAEGLMTSMWYQTPDGHIGSASNSGVWLDADATGKLLISANGANTVWTFSDVVA